MLAILFNKREYNITTSGVTLNLFNHVNRDPICEMFVENLLNGFVPDTPILKLVNIPRSCILGKLISGEKGPNKGLKKGISEPLYFNRDFQPFHPKYLAAQSDSLTPHLTCHNYC